MGVTVRVGTSSVVFGSLTTGTTAFDSSTLDNYTLQS